MNKLIYIFIIAGLYSCKPQGEVFVNRSMMPLSEIEFKLIVYETEFARIDRRFRRNGMDFKYKRIGLHKFCIYLTQEHIEKTVRDKGKRSVLDKKYDPRLRNAIYDEIN